MQKQIIIATAVLIVIAAGVYLTFSDKSPNGTLSPTATSGVVSSGDGIEAIGSGPVTITEVPEQEQPKAPDYNKPLAFSAPVSAEVRTALQKQFDTTIAVLAQKPLDFQAWINLGILRKTAGDYQGAEEVWMYAGAIYPGSTVPFDNLGSLYMDFLKSSAKAEASFKQSIAINPNNINAYQQLFSLYTDYGYKGKAEARALIEQGLKTNPGNETLLQLQAQLQ